MTVKEIKKRYELLLEWGVSPTEAKVHLMYTEMGMNKDEAKSLLNEPQLEQADKHQPLS